MREIYHQRDELIQVMVEEPSAASDFVAVRIRVRLEKEWHILSRQMYPRRAGMRLARAVVLCAVWLDRALNLSRRYECGEPFNTPGMRADRSRVPLEKYIAERAEIEAIRDEDESPRSPSCMAG